MRSYLPAAYLHSSLIINGCVTSFLSTCGRDRVESLIAGVEICGSSYKGRR
jgi:hypothetical protein